MPNLFEHFRAGVSSASAKVTNKRVKCQIYLSISFHHLISSRSVCCVANATYMTLFANATYTTLFANATYMTSSGITFFHSDEDFARLFAESGNLLVADDVVEIEVEHAFEIMSTAKAVVSPCYVFVELHCFHV